MKRTYEEKTILIKELENNCPKLDISIDKYHPNNTKYHQGITAINDAYWRRRMLSAKPGECAPS